MDPVGQLIGTVLIAFGLSIVYGAVKNRRVFGPNGIITQAITRGSISNTSTGEKVVGTAAKPSPKQTGEGDKLLHALNEIINADKALGDEIRSRVDVITPSFSRADLMPLSQLLQIADAKGLKLNTAVVRAYVKGVTGESI